MGMGMLGRARKQGRRFENPVETHVGDLGTMAKVLGLYWKSMRAKEKIERVPREPLPGDDLGHVADPRQFMELAS